MSDNSLLSKKWRLNNLYRIVDRNSNSIPFRLNNVQADVLENLHTRNIILKARQLGMCLDPDTKILKSDLTWVRLSSISVGDELVGVDENTISQGKRRRLKKTFVEGVQYRKEKTYRITFDNGKSIICTGNHRWLTRMTGTDYSWRSIDGESNRKLRVGYKIRRIVTDTWEKGDYESGWIGGMLDGEGSLSLNKRLGSNISISQIEGPVFDRIEKYIKDNDYNYRIELDKAERPSKFGKKPVNKVVISRVDEIMKLIGVTRPSRFLARDWWQNKEMPQVKDGPFSVITSIEYLGFGDVIDLQTSTKTFIAEGYVSHNSTFAVLYLLDEALFEQNLACGIVSYSLEHAQHIFKKIIGHALDTLPKEIKPLVGITQRSAREINFNNGSSLRVDTTLRGGSYPLVLISEFGKTCARNPQKAEEVVTGTLQSVPRDGTVIIESTAEGNSGYFADMILEATRRGNENLSELEYKMFFYSWLTEPSYQVHAKTDYDIKLTDYFNKIEETTGQKIEQPQRNWYAIQTKVLGDKIKQEFPSTVEESFLSSSDAYYFSEAINEAYSSGRCLYTPLYDALLPVYVAMDIGVNDLTVMIFFQVAHGEVRIIDYYEDKNKGVDFYAKFLLQDKKFLYHTIFLPHDSTKRDPLDTSNTYERDFRRLFSGTNTAFHVLKRMDKQLAISHAKNMIARCVFNNSKVKPLLDHLAKYRKKWNEALGRYIEDPYHDIHSNFGDAFIYVSQAVGHLEATSGLKCAFEKHKKATEERYMHRF